MHILRFFLIFFILGCCSFSSLAQDKYIKEAIKQGKNSDNLYHAVIKGNKKVDAKDVIDQCKKHNYIFTNLTNKTIHRFGNEDTGVSSFDFLPKDDLHAYYYEKFKFDKTDSYNGLINEATVFIPLFFPLANLTEIIDASWSGNVQNGLPEGDGFGGGFFDDKSNIVIFKGSFQQGIPVGSFHVKSICYQGLELKKVISKEYNIEIEKASEGLARFKSDGLYGYLSTNTHMVVVKPMFAEATDFNGGKAKVAISKYKFPGSDIYKNYSIKDSLAINDVVYYIDKNGQFVDFSEEQKTIFDKRIASIEYQKERIRLAELKRQREEKERQQRKLMAERREKAKRKREEAREAAREAAKEKELKQIATPIANAFAQAGYGKITSTNYSEYSGYKIEVELKRPVKIDISYVFPGAIYYRTESKNNSYNNFGTWVYYTRYEEYWGYNGYEIEIDSTTHSTTIYIYVKPEEW